MQKETENKVMLNLIQHLPRTLLCKKNSNNMRGRSQIKFGMTSLFYNGAGFTLIELLVVVLIIGILAAVALPQYKVAVLKSRASEGLLLLRTVMQAQEIYYLHNGTYCSSIDQLDVDIPSEHIAESWSGTNSDSPNQYLVSCSKADPADFACISNAANKDLPQFFLAGQFAVNATIGNHPGVAGLLTCGCNAGYNKSSVACAICKTMGKELDANKNYILN